MAVSVKVKNYLNYNESRPIQKAKLLLWPVWVYKILFPKATQRELNLYQLTILRLIQARIVDKEELANLTAIHPDLILLILNQLVNNGYVQNDHKMITPQGEKILDNIEEQEENLQSGYVFQDAITSKIWPRFASNLNLIEPMEERRKSPRFKRNIKTDQFDEGLILNTLEQIISPPEISLILKSWQEYSGDVSASRQLYGYKNKPQSTKLDVIQYLDTKPEKYYVWVWCIAHGFELKLSDPFSFRQEAWWLNESLQDIIQSNPKIVDSIAELIDVPKMKKQTAEEWFKQLQYKADIQVMGEFPWLDKYKSLFDSVAQLLIRLDSINEEACSQNDLKAAVNESQSTIEIIMQWMIKSYPVDKGDLPVSKRYDNQLNQNILESLNLPSFTQSVCENLARIKFNDVLGSLHRPTQSLRTLLFAAALTSIGNDNHPLKNLSDDQLKLEKLLELARLRNPSSHGQSEFTGKKIINVPKEKAIEHIEYTLNFIKQFKEWM